MASYRPFPPQSSFAPAPNQNPLPPAPPPPQQRGSQYNQNWGYNASSGGSSGGDGAVPAAPSSYPPNYNYQHSSYGPPRTQHPHPPPQYNYQPPPPPPPEPSYPQPPPPQAPPAAQNKMPLQPPQAPIYYQNSQYSQYSHQPIQPSQQPPPPPPPPLSPNSSVPPPPPPPGSPPPPPPQSKDSGVDRRSHDKGASREASVSRRREHGHLNHGVPPKQQKPPVPSVPVKKANGPPGRVETEEERRLRKKREFEKQRQEEKHRQQLKDSQNSVLQKTQMLSSGKGHGSIVGSRGDLKYYDGDLKSARSYYFQSLNVRRDAVKHDPNVPSQILDLAVSFAKVADVDRNLGDEDVAVDEFEEGIKLLESLTLKSEESALEQRRLSVMEFLKSQVAEKQTSDVSSAPEERTAEI